MASGGSQPLNDDEEPDAHDEHTVEHKGGSDDRDEEEEEEEEEEEPRLKFATLTKSQAPVYRNGDATSSFLVGGDKMVQAIHRYS